MMLEARWYSASDLSHVAHFHVDVEDDEVGEEPCDWLDDVDDEILCKKEKYLLVSYNFSD